MLKILKKIKFNEKENRMTNVAATEDVIKNYKKGKIKIQIICLQKDLDG